MTFVVQTCVLSSRWKLIWTSMPCLIFSSDHFGPLPKFSKFVTNVLSRRNQPIEVYSVKLYFRGAASQDFVRKIANIVFSHNVQQLNVSCWPKKYYRFPPCMFSSKSLKHLTLSNRPPSFPPPKTPCVTPKKPCITPKIPWDFPALTTMHLSDITLCDYHTKKSLDLFSKCVNLKTLTLKMFTVEGVEVLDIITPRLSTLVIFECRSPIAFNLIAPQLENLTVIKCSIEYLKIPPEISSLCYGGYRPRQLSKHGFRSLNIARIHLFMYSPYRAYMEEDARETINMLYELHSVRYLTLSIDIIECLSSFPYLLSHHPSPFSNLNWLIIDSGMRKGDAYKVKMSPAAKNFLLDNSPNCKFICHHKRLHLPPHRFVHPPHPASTLCSEENNLYPGESLEKSVI